jgi:hypothetical protein
MEYLHLSGYAVTAVVLFKGVKEKRYNWKLDTIIFSAQLKYITLQ